MDNQIHRWTRTAFSFKDLRRAHRACCVERASSDGRRHLACHALASRSPKSPLPVSGQDYLLALTLGGTFEPVIPSVAWTAACLSIEHPDTPAVDILDRAVCAHPEDDLDFQFDADVELSPPHPFAELLRRAFAPHLDPVELRVTLLEEATADDSITRSRRTRVRRHWNHALLQFVERYGLWQPEPL